MSRAHFAIALWLLACSDGEPDTTSERSTDAGPALGSDGAAATLDELAAKPPAPGYERFEPPPIEVAAGESNDWAQWVGGPLDQDYDVIDITGAQTVVGHHGLLYATNEAQPVGLTRLWKDTDQLTTRLMGGVGGEAGGKVVLPPGIVFRVKKGSYLLVQTHYLNATSEPIIGRTLIDVKLTPADPDNRLASIMANTTSDIELAPGLDTTLDVTCEVQQDLEFLQISNHMHEYGISAFTEFTDPSGETHELKTDERWSYEWALNPNFKDFPVAEPLLVPAGSMLRTHCEWNNMTDRPVTFPTEMCVFFGFILNESDIYCESGNWTVTRDTGDAGVAEGDAGPVQDACTGDEDRAIMDDASFDQRSTECATPCALDPDIAACTAACLQAEVGLSPACAGCNGRNVACSAQSCLSECIADGASAPCRDCVEENCAAAYRMCTGI